MKIFFFTICNRDININFLKLRLIFYPVFALALLFSIFLCIFKGVDLGIEFVGGGDISFSLEKEYSISDLRSLISKANFNDLVLQEVGNESKEFSLKIGAKDLQNLESKITIIKDEINSQLENVNYNSFNIIGPQIGKETLKSGIYAVLISLFVIFFYIWYRFDLIFSIGIFLTITNNMIIAFGILSFCSLEINLNIIAAILTIIGYSINDSVVVYDRVRNNLQNKTILNIEKIFTLSINQSLTRTLITSITSLAANLVLIFYGGDAIANFAILVFIGIFLGTVFSIFLAAPIVYDLSKIFKNSKIQIR